MKALVLAVRWLAAMTWVGGWVFAAALPEVGRVRSLFPRPPRDFATAPLWVWNDQLTDAQVVGTLRDLAAQEVRQVFVHPRPGLMTPYLSEEWFRLWRLALREAERLDMNVWIYDENSYPSGFAGGWVPELMPDSRGRGLHLKQTQQPPGLARRGPAAEPGGGRPPPGVLPGARPGPRVPLPRAVPGGSGGLSVSPEPGVHPGETGLSPSQARGLRRTGGRNTG